MWCSKKLQQTENSLTYLNWGDAIDADIPIARMRNKAGNIVAVSTASVKSAMEDIADSVKAGTLLITMFP